jgi:hypothetical protein
MARRTKQQIANEKIVDAACNKACIDKSINIMNLSQISKAAEAAIAAGTDPFAAAEAKAAELDESNKIKN